MDDKQNHGDICFPKMNLADKLAHKWICSINNSYFQNGWRNEEDGRMVYRENGDLVICRKIGLKLHENTFIPTTLVSL